MIEYSVVIPAFNEGAGITSSLTQVVNYMRNFSTSYEVVVVDDGSKDETAAVVEEYAKDHPEIRLIKNPHKGKGFAVRTGVMESVGKYVLMTDADMATPIEELKRLMVWLKDNDFDVAIGSREGIGAERKNEPFYRHLMGRVFNMLIRMLIISGIRDTQCGFKVFKGDVGRDIFRRLILFGPDTPETDVPKVTAFDVEVLVIAKRLNLKIKEVPVKWNYVPTDRVPPLRSSVDMFMDVMKVKWNDLMGKYSS